MKHSKTFRMRLRKLYSSNKGIFGFMLLLSAACSSSPYTGLSFKNKKSQEIHPEIAEIYAATAYERYKSALNASIQLQKGILQFTRSPSPKSHNQVKELWKEARQQYSMTEGFRFYGGPIDHDKHGPEGLLNAWPLDELYIDYTKGAPKAGIIQNPTLYPEISKELLLSLNEKDGEKNISTGFHAIEFLIWGQDFSTSAPGKRSYKDYLPKYSKHASRRSKYLLILSELLVDHLTAITNAWSPNQKNNYRAEFVSLKPKEALTKILTGISTLSSDEMAGERITVALEINDQENEQNCFSDYSLEDSLHNQSGIEIIINTTNPKNTSLLELIKLENSKLATDIQKNSLVIRDLHQQAMQIGTFDKIIANKSETSMGRITLRKLTEHLVNQGAMLAKFGTEIGLELHQQEPQSH